MSRNAIVYTIKNLVNNKVYVGSSLTRERFTTHKRELNRGKHGNPYLQRAWNKYGPDNFSFEVVERCKATVRWVREQWWMDHLRSEDEKFGYNLIPTRISQLYGTAIAKYQRAGWAKLTKEERKERNAHLFEEEVRSRAAKLSGIARSTPEHIERQREIALEFLCTEENRKGNSNRMAERWADPVQRTKMLEGLARGRAKTNSRKDPEFVAKRNAILTEGRNKAIDNMVARRKAGMK